MTVAYINRISTSVPPNDVHRMYIAFGHSQFRDMPREAMLFKRMAQRSGVEHRYSYMTLSHDNANQKIGIDGVYVPNSFPDTATRMQLFKKQAIELAVSAIEKLQLHKERARLTHLILGCCTGFSAPGLDIELVERCKLREEIERTTIGFMGCYAAIPALKLARHIVRSEPRARVLVVNLELCSLHLQETNDLEKMLLFLLFGDGCAASIVSAYPEGIAIDSFRSLLIPDTRELITWDIGNFGFDMTLSGLVPAAIRRHLAKSVPDILGNLPSDAIGQWAVHPGGASVLDAVERALGLAPNKLAVSRDVLRRYGNMSSATVMFILEQILRGVRRDEQGCALSFGPGLVAETMRFRTAA